MSASFVIDDGGFIIIGSSSSKIEYSNTSRDYKRENFSELMVSYYGPMGNRGLILVSAWWFLEQDFLSLFLFVLFFPGIPFLHSFFFLVTSLVHHPFPDRFYFTSILLSHRSPSSRSNIHMCLMQMYDKCIACPFIRLSYKASRNNFKRTMGLRRIVRACVCVSVSIPVGSYKLQMHNSLEAKQSTKRYANNKMSTIENPDSVTISSFPLFQ